MPKYLLISIVGVLGTLASIALWLGRVGTAPETDKLAIERHAFAASPGAVYSTKFMDIQGRSQNLGQWDQKLLVLNFWATWCGPCKEEIPILAAIQTKFAASGLQIVGITPDSPANVVNFAKNIDINYPVLLDESGALEFSKRLGNRLGLLPHTIVLRPGGEVIFAKLGAVTESELGDIIAKNTPTAVKSN